MINSFNVERQACQKQTRKRQQTATASAGSLRFEVIYNARTEGDLLKVAADVARALQSAVNRYDPSHPMPYPDLPPTSV